MAANKHTLRMHDSLPNRLAGGSCPNVGQALSPVNASHLFVAVDRHAQHRIGAQRQNLALSRIVAAQLPHHPPFAIHELAFLHVAEPDDPRPWRVWR